MVPAKPEDRENKEFTSVVFLTYPTTKRTVISAEEYKRTVINPAHFLASFGQAAKLDFFATGCIAIGHFGGGSSK